MTSAAGADYSRGAMGSRGVILCGVGAVGFGLGAATGGGINIAFAKGTYFYLVGQEIPASGSPTTSIPQLVQAAQHLYARVGP